MFPPSRKSALVKKARGMLDAGVLPEELDFHSDEAVREVYSRVKSNSNLESSIGLTRVCRVLAVWINSGDVARIHDAHVSDDAHVSHESHEASPSGSSSACR